MKKLLVPFLFFLSITLDANVRNNSAALHQLVYEIRDPETNRERFRTCLETIGEYVALDVLQELQKEEREVYTLTQAYASHSICCEDPVLVTILRAGVPLMLGVQKVFPEPDVGFIGMARNEETLEAKTDYLALPDMKDRCVILTDTMVATGGSIIEAIKIIEKDAPKEIILLCAISAEAGIAKILEHNPNVKVYSAATDPVLNENGYIVPGLGDAGDRSYGEKR